LTDAANGGTRHVDLKNPFDDESTETGAAAIAFGRPDH
jgi:hypothetical protein